MEKRSFSRGTVGQYRKYGAEMKSLRASFYQNIKTWRKKRSYRGEQIIKKGLY